MLTVEVLTEGVHSGDASGVVPTSFRIARQLIDRVDNAATGMVKERAFHAPIPAQRKSQAKRAAAVLGKEIWRKFPFAGGTKPMHKDLAELVLNRTWRPMLAVTGADGLPPLSNAGNVLRPKTQLLLSLRCRPPTVDAPTAGKRMKQSAGENPPYGAKVITNTARPAPAGTLHSSPLLWRSRSTKLRRNTMEAGDGWGVKAAPSRL